ncbi:hypothetical protein [Frigoriflavimonas asaccharolytica]|uniref:Calx-beta domain-containing protein n=1 Tax=Frigoriflavimonas asaccharolytica TaxID=2735899 RepID=A0A8J8GB34_9FLAO|nr:hypothetical protein [Frigoriflavimonas asaccharolytica]NRS92695.1 hypothetical protein [Frigoriflavimonas asaccharolytica]
MKNIIKLFSIFALFFIVSSCDDSRETISYDGEPSAYFLDKFAVVKGPDVGSKEYNVQIGTIAPLSAATTFKITKVSGNAVEGTDYTVENGGSVTIPAGANLGFVKIKVFGAALSQNAAKTLVFSLTSPITQAEFNNTTSLSLIFGCESALAGAYSFSTTNFGTSASNYPGPKTGTGTLTNVSDGLYLISEASFGAYDVIYGGDFASGVRLKDSCGKLSFDGNNQYGDSFNISNVSVNGTKLTFTWTTSYGEYGTTVLTRTDGKNWPANLY